MLLLCAMCMAARKLNYTNALQMRTVCACNVQAEDVREQVSPQHLTIGGEGPQQMVGTASASCGRLVRCRQSLLPALLTVFIYT